MGHAAVCVRGPASVLRDVRRDQPEHSLSLEAERATSSTARQEDLALTRRHDAAERAHPAGHRRAVPERGDDQIPGARMARRRGTRRASRQVVGQTASPRHALEPQEARQVLEGAPQPCSARANTHRLFIKLCWLMDTHAVGADRVVNIDETSCRLLPVHQIGWGCHGEKQAQLQGNTKEATTFTIAFSTDRCPLDMLVQIVHAGKTDAVLPEKPWPERTRHVTSENGWATTTTILQLAASLDDVMNPSKEGQSWILLWDMHASEATLAAMKAAFPHVVLCASSRHEALRTCSHATWPSSAASRAPSRRRRAPLLPAPSSMAPKAWP